MAAKRLLHSWCCSPHVPPADVSPPPPCDPITTHRPPSFVQLWEAVHASTGLPWLVAIPVGTLAVRGLLLPLSLKAKAASANLLLLDHAVSQVSLGGQGRQAIRGGTANQSVVAPVACRTRSLWCFGEGCCRTSYRSPRGSDVALRSATRLCPKSDARRPICN